MSKEELLAENLKKLKLQDEVLCEKLSEVEGFESLSWCETRSGEQNLVDSRATPKLFLHSSYSIQNELERWWGDLPLEKLKVLYLFGLGTGAVYSKAKQWLAEDPERSLVVLETDLRVILRVLETELGSRILDDDQVLLVWPGDDRKAMDNFCQDLSAYFVGLLFDTVALPSYERAHGELFDYLKMRLLHHAAYISFAGQEFIEYGVRFFNNFYRNMLGIDKSFGCQGVYESFKGMPAIICGAGPSLAKNIDTLRGLKDQALILAGGSAINALRGYGILPHFGGSVDPNPTQFERMKEHAGIRLPVFYKGRTHWKAYDVLEGPHMYLAGNNLYPITDWMQEKLGIEDPVAIEGYNVLHLLIDVARLAGCDPIIFVGMDLAFTGMQQYASSVLEDTSVTEGEITKGEDLNSNAFIRTDIYGKPVYTLWKWVAEAEYTSRYAKDHSETTFINATEGGLGFKDIPNMPLAAVAESHLNQTYAMDQLVSDAIEKGCLAHLGGKVRECYDEIDASLASCLNLCAELDEQFEQMMQAVKRGKGKQIQLASERIAELEAELSVELAFEHILQPVNGLRAILHERKFDLIDKRDDVRSDMQRMLRRCEANREELSCLRECAAINQAILRKALECAHSS